MTHDEFIELVQLATLSQSELARLANMDKRRFSDLIMGHSNHKHYENAICRNIAIRTRFILSKLDEYGHGDK